MRGGRRIQRDRADLDAVGPIDVEGAVCPDGRSGKLAVAAADGEIAIGPSNREAGPAAAPSPDRERAAWFGWPAVARGHDAARDGHQQIRQAFHTLNLAIGRASLQDDVS